ncbi:hypothetical protein LCGC14_0341860 [marine sediment metagenome]|uniref:Uncharacterized protein n=1 Tax=marine sediment metagenome TaxID=412755 RepID=A0A0F9TIS7_9ZZZZ
MSFTQNRENSKGHTNTLHEVTTVYANQDEDIIKTVITSYKDQASKDAGLHHERIQVGIPLSTAPQSIVDPAIAFKTAMETAVQAVVDWDTIKM